MNLVFTPATLELLISNVTSLKYLSFEYLGSFSNEHLLILQELTNNPNLKTLNIGYAPSVDDVVIDLAKNIIPEIIYRKR